MAVRILTISDLYPPDIRGGAEIFTSEAVDGCGNADTRWSSLLAPGGLPWTMSVAAWSTEPRPAGRAVGRG